MRSGIRVPLTPPVITRVCRFSVNPFLYFANRFANLFLSEHIIHGRRQFHFACHSVNSGASKSGKAEAQREHDREKNNLDTGANGNEIIKKQIELLEQVNQKLVDGLNSHPVTLAAYSDIRNNSLAIMNLVNYLDRPSL
jgi:hypothetical protein